MHGTSILRFPSLLLTGGLALMLCTPPSTAQAFDLLGEIGGGLESIGTAVNEGVKQGVKSSTTTKGTASGSDVIWPGEDKPPANGGKEAWNGYNEQNCPGMGRLRSPREIRAHSECVTRDMGYDDDWAALKKKHVDAAEANDAHKKQSIEAIQKDSQNSFAKLQAQAQRDAVAARIAAHAAQTQK